MVVPEVTSSALTNKHPLNSVARAQLYPDPWPWSSRTRIFSVLEPESQGRKEDEMLSESEENLKKLGSTHLLPVTPPEALTPRSRMVRLYTRLSDFLTLPVYFFQCSAPRSSRVCAFCGLGLRLRTMCTPQQHNELRRARFMSLASVLCLWYTAWPPIMAFYRSSLATLGVERDDRA